MTAAYDLWIDFNDVDNHGHTTTLAGFASAPIPVGATLTVGDDEGNWARAKVLRIYHHAQDTPPLVDLAVDLDTCRGARQPMPTPCSPWCLVRKDDPDHRRWRWCRHRRRK